MTYSPEEKLKWEIEKLRAETRTLKRPWIANLASWLALVTTLIALTTAFSQYRLNKIETAQLHLDGTKIKVENDSLALKKKTLTLQVQSLTQTLKATASRLTASLVDSTHSSPGPDNAQTVRQLQTSVEALNTIDEAHPESELIGSICGYDRYVTNPGQGPQTGKRHHGPAREPVFN